LLLLIAVYYDILTVEGFVYATAGLYFGITSEQCSTHLAYKTRFSVCHQQIQRNINVYFYIILSGSVANLLLDGDKIMLNQYMVIDICFFIR
jgi:hypothetical protein